MKADIIRQLLVAAEVLDASARLSSGQTYGATASSGQPAARSQTFHIELNTLRGCFKNGWPSLMLDFGDKDFAVLQRGHPYPVQVMWADKPDFPTHLLVVYGAGATRPGDAELADRLKGPLSRRWLVSVERTDGSLTPYSNRQTHGQAPAATASVALNGSEADAGVQEAIETLKGFQGRRVLLFVSSRHGTLPDAVSEAAKSLFPVHVVDGGEKR